MRPMAKALRSVLTIASWPINSLNSLGRYLRASATWLGGGAGASASRSEARLGALFFCSLASAIEDPTLARTLGLEGAFSSAPAHYTALRQVGGWTSNPRNAR